MKVVALGYAAGGDLHASCCGAKDENFARQDKGMQLQVELSNMRVVTGESCGACMEVKSLGGYWQQPTINPRLSTGSG